MRTPETTQKHHEPQEQYEKEEPRTPAEEPRTPVKEPRTLIEELRTPVGKPRTPDEKLRTPRTSQLYAPLVKLGYLGIHEKPEELRPPWFMEQLMEEKLELC